MNNRGSDRSQVERRNGGERRNQRMPVPVKKDKRSGEVRRYADRRTVIDRRDN